MRSTKRRPTWAAAPESPRPAGAAVATAVACFAAYLAWLLSGSGGALRVLIADVTSIPLPAAAAVAAWRAARRASDAGTRRAWRCCAGAFAAYGLGNVIWTYYEVVLGLRPSPSPADGVFMWYYPLLLVGLLSFPTARGGQRERATFWLDMSAVMLAGGALLWLLIFHPALHGRRLAPTDLLITLAYPVADLALLFGSAAALLHRPVGRSLPVGLLGASGLLLFVTDAACYSLSLGDGQYRSGHWIDAGWQLAALLWLLAPLLAGRGSRGAEIAEPRPRAVAMLPYVAVAIGYLMLLGEAMRSPSELPATLVVIAGALTAIVTARQVLAQRENARLVAARDASDLRFRALVQHSSDVITVLDADGRISYISPAVERVLGRTPQRHAEGWLHDAVHPEDEARAQEFLAALRARPGEARVVTLRFRDARGRWRHVETVGTSLLHDPAVAGIVLNTRDVSERALLEAELTRQAFSDPLTGLANRSRFRERVAGSLARAGDHASSVAVLFVDLDDFKTVNDSLGHSAGDRLLVIVAERLLDATRGSDTVARLGGDEFAVLIERATSDRDAVIVAERIAQALRRPVLVEGSEIVIAASVGIARGSAGEGVDELLRNADVAMYAAKRSGKNDHAIFEPRMHERARARLTVEADLRRAIERYELVLHFQPVVGLARGEIIGAEALVRWQHPSRGLLSPEEFIPLAEESGLIHPLGRWVLREACRQAARWAEQAAPRRPLTVGVNISARQFQQPAFAEEVRLALADAGLPPSALLLEITESALVSDSEETLARLQELKAAGVHLAIDDFGMGYSSLGYLHRLPIDVLKIDKAFVDELGIGSDGGALARTIIALADALGLITVAEGIERASQADALRAMGCRVGQGFHFAHPMGADDVAMLLRGSDALAGALAGGA